MSCRILLLQAVSVEICKCDRNLRGDIKYPYPEVDDLVHFSGCKISEQNEKIATQEQGDTDLEQERCSCSYRHPRNDHIDKKKCKVEYTQNALKVKHSCCLQDDQADNEKCKTDQ